MRRRFSMIELWQDTAFEGVRDSSKNIVILLNYSYLKAVHFSEFSDKDHFDELYVDNNKSTRK